jgi:hypothetical protein
MKRFVNVPECWEEMTPKQFKYLLKLFFRMMINPKIEPEDILNDFADYLMGRKRYIFPLQQERYLVLIHQLAQHLSWLFELDDEGKVSLAFITTQNLIPSIQGLLGPQSHGSDLLFGEYRLAVDLFNRYTQEHDIEDLNALVGVLYRKAVKETDFSEFNGQYREPFNKYLIEKYHDRAVSLPDYLKWGVYLWFGSLCRYIVTGGEFIIEGNTVSFESIFQRGKEDPDERQVNSIGMTSVLFSLADAGTFGNAEQTDETELFKVLLKLLHDKQTIDEMNRQ